jgi:hypothetical protein
LRDSPSPAYKTCEENNTVNHFQNSTCPHC